MTLVRLARHQRRQPELERRARRFDPASVDCLFVLVGDGRRWFIPSQRVEGAGGTLRSAAQVLGVRDRAGRPIGALVYGARRRL